MHLLNRKKSNYGYCLLEAMVALAIIVVLATTALPSWSYFDRLRLKYEVHKLSETFWYLKQKARACGTKQNLTFDLDSKSYSYVSRSNTKVSRRLQKGILFGSSQEALGPPAEPKRAITKVITFPKNEVVFYPNGTITSGSAYLKTKNGAKAMAVTIPVAHLSLIRVYTMENGRWHIET